MTVTSLATMQSGERASVSHGTAATVAAIGIGIGTGVTAIETAATAIAIGTVIGTSATVTGAAIGTVEGARQGTGIGIAAGAAAAAAVSGHHGAIATRATGGGEQRVRSCRAGPMTTVTPAACRQVACLAAV